MGKLPDMVFGPVPDAASAYERLGAAQKQLADTLSVGVTAGARYMAETEKGKAKGDLARRLTQDKKVFEQNPYIDPQTVRTELGDEGYAALPDDMRRRAEAPVTEADPRTGVPTQRPRGFASYEVFDPIFKKRTQRHIDETAATISTYGYREEFKREAEVEALGHWNQMQGEQFARWQKDQAAQTAANIHAAVNQGLFGDAHAELERLRRFVGTGAAEPFAKLVRAGQQEMPISAAVEYAALHGKDDPLGAKARLDDAARRLQSPQNLPDIEVAHQRELTRMVATQMHALQKGDTEATVGQVLKIVRDNAGGDPNKANAIIEGLFHEGGQVVPGPTVSDETGEPLAPAITKAGPFAGNWAAYKESLAAVASEMERAAKRKEYDEKQLGDLIVAYWQGQPGPDGQLHPSYRNIPVALQEAARGSQPLMRLLETLRTQDRHAVTWAWEDLSRSHEKQGWRTDAQDSRKFFLLKSFAENAEDWAAMSAAQQLGVIVGVAPIPGQPTAPTTALNQRDRDELFKQAQEMAAKQRSGELIQSPEKIAWESVALQYPNLRSHTPGPQAQRAYVEMVKRISDYVNNERTKGRKPDVRELYEYADGQLRTIYFRNSFLGIPYNSQKARQELELEGTQYQDPERPGRTIRPPTPVERALMKPGDVVIYDPNGWYRFLPKKDLSKLPEGWTVEGGYDPKRFSMPGASPGQQQGPTTTPPQLTTWSSHFEAAGQKYGIPPSVLMAVAMRESGGDPTVISDKGAGGLMQFMPATADQYRIDRFDPAQAIEGAAHYLSDLKEQFGGRLDLAIAAYHAGPGAVQKAGNAIPQDTNDGQTYTKDYVAQVTAIATQLGYGTEPRAAPVPGLLSPSHTASRDDQPILFKHENGDTYWGHWSEVETAKKAGYLPAPGELGPAKAIPAAPAEAPAPAATPAPAVPRTAPDPWTNVVPPPPADPVVQMVRREEAQAAERQGKELAAYLEGKKKDDAELAARVAASARAHAEDEKRLKAQNDARAARAAKGKAALDERSIKGKVDDVIAQMKHAEVYPRMTSMGADNARAKVKEIDARRGQVEREIRAVFPEWESYRKAHPNGDSFVEWFLKNRPMKEGLADAR